MSGLFNYIQGAVSSAALTVTGLVALGMATDPVTALEAAVADVEGLGYGLIDALGNITEAVTVNGLVSEGEDAPLERTVRLAMTCATNTSLLFLKDIPDYLKPAWNATCTQQRLVCQNGNCEDKDLGSLTAIRYLLPGAPSCLDDSLLRNGILSVCANPYDGSGELSTAAGVGIAVGATVLMAGCIYGAVKYKPEDKEAVNGGELTAVLLHQKAEDPAEDPGQDPGIV